MSGDALLTRDQAKALADRVLKFSSADETRVNIASTWSGNTRFADSSITTSGGSADVSVTVTVTPTGTPHRGGDLSLLRCADLLLSGNAAGVAAHPRIR